MDGYLNAYIVLPFRHYISNRFSSLDIIIRISILQLLLSIINSRITVMEEAQGQIQGVFGS